MRKPSVGTLHAKPRGRAAAASDWRFPRWWSPVLDLVAGITISVTFAFGLGTIGALMFLLVIPLQVIRYPKYIFEVSAANLILFAYPLFTVASCLWSMAPAETMRGSVELVLTLLVALMITPSQGLKRMHLGLALGLAMYVASSIVFGHSIHVGGAAAGAADSAFGGLNGRKNITGHVAALSFILNASAAFVYAKIDRRVAWLAGICAALSVVEVVLTRSAGAIIGTIVAMGVLFTFENTRRFSIQTKGIVILAAIVMVLPLVFIAREIQSWLFTNVLAFFGKDATLTGRTHLWELADQLIATRPWLGRGYNAFWLQGNPDAEGIWTWARIANRFGFNFHNNAREMVVQTGYVGLAIAIASVLPYVLISMFRAVSAPVYRSGLAISALVYECMRLHVESAIPAPFGFDTILVILALYIDPHEFRVAAWGGLTLRGRSNGAWVGPSNRGLVRQGRRDGRQSRRSKLMGPDNRPAHVDRPGELP